MHTLLLVEDDEILANRVSEFLQQSGFNVTIALDGKQALVAFKNTSVDLVLLDWMLPEISGIDLCREFRMISNIPIIMLTAKSEESDKIVGLELGADDYMTKPYSLKELLARIRSNLRRQHASPTPAEVPVNSESMEFPHFSLNLTSHKLIVKGNTIETTRSEFDLLLLFCQHPERVYNRNDLLNQLNGKEHGAFDRSIDMHISNIRKKIEPDPKKPIYLKTVWGVGYQFEIPVDIE